MASKTFGRLFFKGVGILAFCVVSAYALFLAYGYNLDLQHRNIEKTSIIDLASRYAELRVYMNDKLIGNSLPLQIKDLVAGIYKLTVQKSGFLPWSRDLAVTTDVVSKVDDLVLVPENAAALTSQLSHFSEKSRYFYGKDFFIVLSPDQDYLTLVSLLDRGTMKEEELKLVNKDIKNIADIHIYSEQNGQKFLITFVDKSNEWVEFNGPHFVDFNLPASVQNLTFLPDQNAAFFLNDGNLYRLPIASLPTVTAKNLADFLLVKNVEQFDVHTGKLVYIARSGADGKPGGKGAGLVYSADDQGKKVRLLAGLLGPKFVRFVPSTRGFSGFYILRTKDNKRSLYLADEVEAELLTSKLKGDIDQDDSGNLFFSDDSGAIFIYKPLLKKKFLVTTLAGDFGLIGQLFNDGHFVFKRPALVATAAKSPGEEILLADSSFSNVYPLMAANSNVHYFLHNGAVFTLNEADQKLKALYFLPK